MFDLVIQGPLDNTSLQHVGNYHTQFKNIIVSHWKERGDVWSFKSMYENPNLEGQRPMPDSIVTIASVFKSQGYKTGMIGKWGLGAPNTNSIPNKKGFDL